MGNIYYKRFSLVLGNPLFPKYLRWAYEQGLKDVKALELNPTFNKKYFTCLLCGCGNEQTADTFIQFVTSKNPSAKIHIVDRGEEQITAIKKLVEVKYKHLDISIHHRNVLEYKLVIGSNSIDWIETDGFMEYFDSPSLEKLLTRWHTWLKSDGFITTRDCVTEGPLTKIGDFLRIQIAKSWLNVKLYPHTRREFQTLFSKIGFKYSFGNTWFYTYRRFALIKK